MITPASALKPAGEQPQTLRMDLERGRHYPIRIVWENSGGPGNFKFDVKAPDGSVVVDANTGASDVLVRCSCDGTSAPTFPLFESETTQSTVAPPAPARGIGVVPTTYAFRQVLRVREKTRLGL